MMKVCYFTATGNCLYVAKRIGCEALSIKPIYTRTKPRQKTNDAVMPENALGKGLSDILFMCIQMLLSFSPAAFLPAWKTPGIFSKSPRFLLPEADRRGGNRDQRSRRS